MPMELRITARRAGRLSSFLRGELKMSTGLMNRLKWGNAIRVNGLAQHTDYPVKPGDVITVALEEEAPEYPAEEGPLTILFEDDWLLAVDKPAGLLIHPSRAKNTGTLANFVAGYYQKTGQKCAFHPLTRLDRDTFGIVLLAKNSHIHALLQQEKPRKTYHALVFGGPLEDAGTVNAPIARCPLPSLLRKIDPEGKPCTTQYRVLERLGDVSRLELRPSPAAPTSSGSTVPISAAPSWGTPNMEQKKVRLILQGLESKPSSSGPKGWNSPTPSPGNTWHWIPKCPSSSCKIPSPQMGEGIIFIVVSSSSLHFQKRKSTFG